MRMENMVNLVQKIAIIGDFPKADLVGFLRQNLEVI